MTDKTDLRAKINEALKDQLSPAYQAKLDAVLDEHEGKKGTIETKDPGRASFPGERISTATGQESSSSSTAGKESGNRK